MTLSDNDKTKARLQAKRELEASIYRLSLYLGVDPESVSEGMSIPVSQQDEPARYQSFTHLIAQLRALNLLN